ncbi:MAG TPA: hypothetical protein VMR43_06340, partial [Variovorax sp.]|nr:hypothetical protein [Variovorax sp.]
MADDATSVQDAGWLELPSDVARAADGASRPAFDDVRFSLDTPAAGAVVDLARTQGCSVRVVCGVAWALVLARLGGQDHFSIGSGAGGSMHPLRADLRGDPSLGTLLARFDQALRDADAQGAPATGTAALPAGFRFGSLQPSAHGGDLLP